MAYSPPAYTAVDFELGPSYTAPAHNAVDFSWASADPTLYVNASSTVAFSGLSFATAQFTSAGATSSTTVARGIVESVATVAATSSTYFDTGIRDWILDSAAQASFVGRSFNQAAFASDGVASPYFEQYMTLVMAGSSTVSMVLHRFVPAKFVGDGYSRGLFGGVFESQSAAVVSGRAQGSFITTYQSGADFSVSANTASEFFGRAIKPFETSIQCISEAAFPAGSEAAILCTSDVSMVPLVIIPSVAQSFGYAAANFNGIYQMPARMSVQCFSPTAFVSIGASAGAALTVTSTTTPAFVGRSTNQTAGESAGTATCSFLTSTIKPSGFDAAIASLFSPVGDPVKDVVFEITANSLSGFVGDYLTQPINILTGMEDSVSVRTLENSVWVRT